MKKIIDFTVSKEDYEKQTIIANSIIKDLSALLSDIDAEIIEYKVSRIIPIMAEIKAYKEDEENRKLRRTFHNAYSDGLFAIAGGKGMYELYDGRSSKMVEEVLREMHARTINARNEKIAYKLLPFGIKNIKGAIGKTHNGYTGIYTADTNKGTKIITIKVIVAGGYNIQCRHYRLLTTVKSPK